MQVGWWAGGLGRGQGSLFTCKEPPDWQGNTASPARHGPSTPASLIRPLALLYCHSRPMDTTVVDVPRTSIALAVSLLLKNILTA